MTELPSISVDTLQPPIFIYGSLRMGGMERVIGESNLIETAPAFVRGVKKGMGDLFLCADVTHDIAARTEGKLCYVRNDTYEATIEILDEYEGVKDGYYRRHLIFAQKFSKSGLFIPAWLYSRGEKL